MLPRVAIALCLTVVGCKAAANDSSDDVGVDAGSEDVGPGASALGYVPADAHHGGDANATEALIARAQESVRQARTASGFVALAVTFVRRSRELSDPRVLRYAQDAVDAALALDAHDVHAMDLDGMLLLEQHRFAQARELARRVLTAHPDDTTALILLGDSLLELGDYEQGFEAYQQAMNVRPDLRTYNRAAYVRWLTGDADGAVQLLGMALDAGSSRDPESLAWCLVDGANVAWHAGHFEEALDAAERSLRVVSDYVPGLRAKSNALHALGRRAEAIAVLEHVVTRRPLVDDLLTLADWLTEAGRPSQSAERVAEAERMRRDDPRALAVYYARHATHVAQAVTLAERELSARHNVYSHDAMALALARAGRTPEARRHMDTALALGTIDARLWLHDALVRSLAGDTSGARASLERADTLNARADELVHAEVVVAMLGAGR